SVSRTDVYKGQPVRLTLKLYKRVQLGGVSGSKTPAFNGFWSQELPQNQNRPWQRETYSGKVYDAIVLSEYLLYPQQSGRLNIEPFELTAVAQVIVQQRGQSIFDDFFGGGPMEQEVQKELKSRPISVTVRDFPAGAPAGFNGAVGDFTMEASLSAQSIAANSAATYTVKISGSGNLPLIQAPRISMPGSMEQYNIKTTESLSSSAAGISGYRQFEYPFIARAEGLCTIDEVRFSYFNPETGRYATLSAPAADLNVTADSGASPRGEGGGLVSGLTKEDIKVLGKDIRFIKIGDAALRPAGRMMMLSVPYFALLALLAALAVGAWYWLRRRMRMMGNAAVVRGKRANKAALGRLKAADKLRREGDRRRFLEEMLRALWGYMGDRLNIPAANLTRENVRERLARRGTPAQLIERYIDVISDCELAQYSPETSGQTDELYRAGVEAISSMESSLK
ncbi:MAG: BatD family protein, partial [Rikenellaceae bacterium]|nr:BatD family protein [Rikenellaceae bacterium]